MSSPTTPTEWQHWAEQLMAARNRGDLEACLALREEDAASCGPEVLARALDEERRWHAERALKRATWRLKDWRTGWALRIAPWLGSGS